MSEEKASAGRMAGQVAFVTLPGGADDGDRAEALARALGAEGATVVLVAADADAAGRLAATLPGAAVFCPGEGVDDDVNALVELAAELAGRP